MGPHFINLLKNGCILVCGWPLGLVEEEIPPKWPFESFFWFSVDCSCDRSWILLFGSSFASQSSSILSFSLFVFFFFTYERYRCRLCYFFFRLYLRTSRGRSLKLAHLSCCAPLSRIGYAYSPAVTLFFSLKRYYDFCVAKISCRLTHAS